METRVKDIKEATEMSNYVPYEVKLGVRDALIPIESVTTA